VPRRRVAGFAVDIVGDEDRPPDLACRGVGRRWCRRIIGARGER